MKPKFSSQVPVPVRRKSRLKRNPALKELPPGQSVGPLDKAVAKCLVAHFRRNGIPHTQQVEEGGIRVWRLEATESEPVSAV